MALQDKDFNVYPKFRHNLWTNYEDNKDVTILTVSDADFEVPKDEADKFMQIRSFCTGFNTIEDIANKTSLTISTINELIDPLIQADILHKPFKNIHEISVENLVLTLKAAARIWGDQLAETSISRDVFLGKTSKKVLLGWLLETYHYIKAFPCCINEAIEASDGALRDLLITYRDQEVGHEEFIVQSLIKSGFTREEIEESIPLISTRTIILLFKEVFRYEPYSVLIVANIIESDAFDAGSASSEVLKLVKLHQLPHDMFDSFLKHILIDDQLGHQKLLDNNIELMTYFDKSKLHDVVNMIHDIKHAFDLQKLEIKDYYDKVGNYIPRQKVDFFAI